MAMVLGRRCELAGAMAAATGKTEGEKRTTTTASRLLKDGQEARGSHDAAFSRASTTPKTATTTPGSKPKVAGGVARAVSTVQRIYRIAIHLNFQITPKFV